MRVTDHERRVIVCIFSVQPIAAFFLSWFLLNCRAIFLNVFLTLELKHSSLKNLLFMSSKSCCCGRPRIFLAIWMIFPHWF